MVGWFGTLMGRRLVGPGIGAHRRMLVAVAAAGSDGDIGMLAGGYIDRIGQTGGDSSRHHRHDSGPGGPGDGGPEQKRITAGDTPSGAH